MGNSGNVIPLNITSVLLGHFCGGPPQLSRKLMILCCKLVPEFITPPPETKRVGSFSFRFSVGSSVLGLGRVVVWFPQGANQPRDLL